MSASAADMASKFARAGSRLQAVPRAGVTQACAAAKVVMLAEAQRAGVLTMSGVGRKGSKVGVGYDVRGGGGTATGIVQYRGPAHLANNPTKAHTITPRNRRGRGKRALSPAGRPWAAASADHPGTKGKKFFESAEPKVAAQTVAIHRQEVRRQLVSVFGT